MIVKEITEYLKEKTNSTVIVSLVLFYMLCNCRWIFASLFTDQALVFEKYGLLKNEYIYQHFIELHPDNVLFWVCSIIAPIALTYLYIWWAPKILINPAYKKQLQYSNERRLMKLQAERKVLEAKGDTIKQESKNADDLIKLEDKKKALAENNPELEFDDAFDQFISSRENLNALVGLIDLMYQHSGYLTTDVDPDQRMIWDINGLTRASDSSKGILDITEKGKAFLKRFSAMSK